MLVRKARKLYFSQRPRLAIQYARNGRHCSGLHCLTDLEAGIWCRFDISMGRPALGQFDIIFGRAAWQACSTAFDLATN
jgi:hypothetical protein